MQRRHTINIQFAAACSVAVLAWLGVAMRAPAFADSIPGVCVQNCNTYVPVPIPSGPTADQLKRQREEKDLSDAALDANDRGVEAYERGDYEAAVKYFTEASDEVPDNPEYARRLERAQAALRESIAAREAKSANAHGNDARQMTGEASSAEARHVFDTYGNPAGSIDAPPVVAGRGKGDPVVPAGRQTPEIATYERERTMLRKNIADLDAQLKRLDPKKDAVAISNIKQQKSTRQDKVNYLNFSIEAALEKASPPQRQGAR